MYAFSRLFLRGLINNIQTSWVKMGVDVAALTLKAGCNDFSGTLMEESITAQAGGDAGEFVPVDLIERKAAEMGRIRRRARYSLPKALRKASSQWGEADCSPPQRASRRLRGEWVQLSSCAGWYSGSSRGG